MFWKTEMGDEFIGSESISCIPHTLHYKTKNTELIGTKSRKPYQDFNGIWKDNNHFKKCSLIAFFLHYIQKILVQGEYCILNGTPNIYTSEIYREIFIIMGFQLETHRNLGKSPLKIFLEAKR